MTKLTAEQINELIKLRGLGYTQEEIADRIGVSKATIGFRLRRLHEIAEKEGIDHLFYRTIISDYIAKMLTLISAIDKEERPKEVEK